MVVTFRLGYPQTEFYPLEVFSNHFDLIKTVIIQKKDPVMQQDQFLSQFVLFKIQQTFTTKIILSSPVIEVPLDSHHNGSCASYKRNAG